MTEQVLVAVPAARLPTSLPLSLWVIPLPFLPCEWLHSSAWAAIKTGRLENNRNLFPTVLGPGKSKIRVPANLVSSKISLPSVQQRATCLLCLHTVFPLCMQREGELWSFFLSLKGYSSYQIRALPLWLNCFYNRSISIHSSVEVYGFNI